MCISFGSWGLKNLECEWEIIYKNTLQTKHFVHYFFTVRLSPRTYLFIYLFRLYPPLQIKIACTDGIFLFCLQKVIIILQIVFDFWCTEDKWIFPFFYVFVHIYPTNLLWCAHLKSWFLKKNNFPVFHKYQHGKMVFSLREIHGHCSVYSLDVSSLPKYI